MISGHWLEIEWKTSAIRYADFELRSKNWPLDLGTTGCSC